LDSATKRLFTAIFHDAHVFDVDFSHWDRWVRLVVFGGVAKPDFNAEGVFHKVDFVDVVELTWKTNHLGVEPDRHFQWGIAKSAIVKLPGRIRIALSGVGCAPALSLVCCDVQISEMSTDTLTALNPHWRKPYQPLVRPDIEGLLKLRNAKSRRRRRIH
jgi:hypothetical protein